MVFYNKLYKKKKTPEEFHNFVIIFAFTGIQTDLPTDGGSVGGFLILVAGGSNLNGKWINKNWRFQYGD